jgi:hypothetical protein
MELKGFIIIPISYGDNKKTLTLHCCRSVPDVHINEISLYDTISELFGHPDEALYFESYMTPVPEVADLNVKYVVLPEAPAPELTFNDVCVSAIDGMMSLEYECGCYSEYTCGYGGFDFLVNQHSIFEELAQHEGKYIWLNI